MTIDADKLIRNVQRMSVEQLRQLADDLDKRDPAILASGRIGEKELPEAFVAVLVAARSGPGVDVLPRNFGGRYDQSQGLTETE